MDLEMENDVMESDEQADNSEIEENDEPSNDDNSQDDDKEPESKEETDAEKSRFASIEEATKAHAELQKKLGLQSNELGELRKRVAEAEQREASKKLQEAQSKGFETISEYENSKEVATFTADKYAEHINECEFPDEMNKLLEEYRKDPSDELLEAIESQFSLGTIKKVAGKTEHFKGELQARDNEALMKEIKDSAANYLNENVSKHQELFKNPAFAALYGEAFRAYGCDLDTDKFVELMVNFAETVKKAEAIKKGINDENDDETSEIAGVSSVGSSGTKGGKSLLAMSSAELDKRLDDLI
jgi:hypothetical protein